MTNFLLPVTVVILVIVLLLLWKERHRARRIEGRIRVEDALKHLYFCDLETRRPTLASIAGRVQISENQAAGLVREMQERGLIRMNDATIQLTAEGRAYALHIVRAHRLWERHLADETGYDATSWHIQAEEIEHELSPTDTAELAGRLGYPLTDPHGDPIPTVRGELAGPQGSPLTTLAPGAIARIIHLEDEPDDIYAQLATLGLYPGMLVQRLEDASEQVCILTDGVEHLLPPIAAVNVTVVPVSAPVATVAAATLVDLSPPDAGRVVGISQRCRGAERRRLLDLGIVPGTVIAAELVSPIGDPIAFRVRDTLIALRREQACLIQIERLPAQKRATVAQHRKMA